MASSAYYQQRFNEDLDRGQYGNSIREYSWSGSILGVLGKNYGLSSLAGQLYNAFDPHPPDSDGWYDYTDYYPPNVLLQFERENNGLLRDTWIGYADFPPEFNVANLKWRFTGIGKHQLESK